ncbi:hypothetical protein [Christiangramia sediminis]|uniref:Uncharacterized protein n=1 Tax=Christiangramia sediminis TaxID=2881336 RepID=A0A9X1LKG2_9FLAO|nr:hypothetical protein [Christiangramia sediminis]MCB7482026.1 hypothetical protein [Christiangramia sediminis]
MKSFKNHFRFFAPFISLVFLLQSCSIYYKDNLSPREAVETERKVRVTTNQDEKLIFNKLEENTGSFYGLTKKNSGTSKKLQKMGINGSAQGPLYSFGLETLKIKEVHAKNYTASTLATIGISFIGLVAVTVAIVGIALSDGFFDGDSLWAY